MILSDENYEKVEKLLEHVEKRMAAHSAIGNTEGSA